MRSSPLLNGLLFWAACSSSSPAADGGSSPAADGGSSPASDLALTDGAIDTVDGHRNDVTPTLHGATSTSGQSKYYRAGYPIWDTNFDQLGRVVV